jgi:alpha-L-fucosidase 2
MKRYTLLPFLLLGLVYGLTAQSAIQPSPHDLVFDQLAGSWDEGIPLGNGMMGALVWEKEGKLRISLDRADLWDLRPMVNVYKEAYNYKWVKQNWEENHYKNVQKAFDEPYDQSAGPSKIPAAALEIPLEGFGPVESVRLYTHHGLCRIEWKSGISMELFVDPEEPVGWFRITGVDRDGEINLVPPPYTVDAEPSSRNKVTGGQDLGRLEYPAGQIENGPDHFEYDQEGWDGFKYRVVCQVDRSDEALTGYWSISSHYPEQENVVLASEVVKNAGNSGYDQSREQLINWWHQYWSRSAITLPDEILEKQWYLEMYKFGAAARKGAPPISLQAVWTADNGKLPPWKGDFHHDLNTQLSYWPAYAGNHLDLEEGFLDWLWSIRDEGKRYTLWFYETEGLNIPGVTTLTGVPMGGWIQYSFSPTVSAWLGHHFFLHWKYSRDENFLEERAYPWMKEVAVFLDQISVKDASGVRKLPISSSPEIFNNSREAWFGETTNYDLSLIRFTYSAAAELATELGLQEEADRWNEILAEWPQLTVDPETGLMFAPGFPYHESHRHFSHLMGFHPLGLLDVSHGTADQKVIYNTLRNLEKQGPDNWTGYSYSWQGNLYARALEGENAAAALKDFATCFTLPNSFHVNGDQSGTGKSKMTYRPFTLEGNFAFASAIHEMLLQSHTGVIRIFPAIPESWKEVSFKKLRTEGAFLVSAKREGGKVTHVEIVAERSGTLYLADPFGEGSDQEVMTIPMKEGEILLLPEDE